MKIQLESTTKIVELVIDGKKVPARIWEGHSAAGVPCHAFITRLAVANDLGPEAHAHFERELREQVPPTAAIAQTYSDAAALIL